MSNCGTRPWPSQYPPFHPRKWMSNAHVQTIAGNYLLRPDRLPPAEPVLVEVCAPHGTQISSEVLCECHWQTEEVRRTRPTAVILHGLEGSSRSQYVIGNAGKLWAAGCNVVRMNMRNCGGRDFGMARRTPTLYHSGLSGDVERVLRFFVERERLTSVALIGYSMGGNLVLKLAGELGTAAPVELRCVVGVSPAADLAASADALHDLSNRLYERKFLHALLKRYRRKVALFPRAFDPQRAYGIRSLRDFDERITALYSGFQSAQDYYERAAAARVIADIAVPTLILHACDDPFIRFTPHTRALMASNACIQLLETEHGGHCAFLADPLPASANDGYWAEHTLLRFVLEHA